MSTDSTDAGVQSTDPNDLVRTKEQRQALLDKAKAKLVEQKWYVLNPFRLDRHLRELGIFGSTQILTTILTAMDEIEPEHYNGQFPPELSDEEKLEGAPLLAFAWRSAHFGCPMYFKFCFYGEHESLYIVSFHQQRKRAKS